MIKMCVFDVDGTLYDYYNHCIPSSTIQALKSLQEKGIQIAVATGRCHYGLKPCRSHHEKHPDQPSFLQSYSPASLSEQQLT